ncbi:MAG: glycosyltransferase [Hymenobacter sp.]|nr:glycosyltransferase [Hymenobacter sp.]
MAQPAAAPIVSIVIPCYNSGDFLPAALESVFRYPGPEPYEVIVVDDGSTDKHTQEVLQKAAAEGCQVIYQENKGPAAARNKGIAHARGEYILFLDSDNKIRPDYIRQGIAVLNHRPEVGVVYGKASFFGEVAAPRFAGQPFDPYQLLKENYIDMCSVIRRSMWEELGGLDEARLLMGHEDWEFWIRAAGAGWQFQYVDEILFDYRIRANSLITEAVQPEAYRTMLAYVHAKHAPQYVKAFDYLYWQHRAYEHDRHQPVRSFFKYLYLEYVKR